MSDEWQNGYKAGYEAGFEAATSSKNVRRNYHENNFPTLTSTQIGALKPEDISNLDVDYEEVYGQAIFRSMKQAHEFK